MANCDDIKLEPLCQKNDQKQSSKVVKTEIKLQYSVLETPPCILIISLAIQVRF